MENVDALNISGLFEVEDQEVGSSIGRPQDNEGWQEVRKSPRKKALLPRQPAIGKAKGAVFDRARHKGKTIHPRVVDTHDGNVPLGNGSIGANRALVRPEPLDL